jgi:hypothetical protein
MKLRINASTAVERRYLEVDELEVTFQQTNAFGGVEHIAYKDIDAVVRDHASLSIQVGRTIYKVPYKSTNKEHTQLVIMLIEGCRKTLA